MIEVKITTLTKGLPPSKHRVSVVANLEPVGSQRGMTLTSVAMAHKDGVERDIRVCLEEAFADILRQIVAF